MVKGRVLVLDSDPKARDSICELASQAGYYAEIAVDERDALIKLRNNGYDVIFTDRSFLKNRSFSRQLKQIGNNINIVVTANYDSLELAVETLRSHVSEDLIKSLGNSKASVLGFSDSSHHPRTRGPTRDWYCAPTYEMSNNSGQEKQNYVVIQGSEPDVLDFEASAGMKLRENIDTMFSWITGQILYYVNAATSFLMTLSDSLYGHGMPCPYGDPRNGSSTQFVIRASSGHHKDRVMNISWEDDQEGIKEVLQTKAPLFKRGASADALLEGTGLSGCSILIIPVTLGDLDSSYPPRTRGPTREHIVALLNLIFESDVEHIPTGAMSSLHMLAKQCGIVYQNSYLYKAMDQKLTQLAVLREISKQINSSLDLDWITRYIAELMESETVSISLLTGRHGIAAGNGEDLVVYAACGIDSESIIGSKQKIGEGIAEFAAQTGEPLLIMDLEEDHRFRNSRRYRSGPCIIVPLMRDGHMIGVINASKLSHADFSREDLRFLSVLAKEIPNSVSNARLLSDLNQSLTHLREQNQHFSLELKQKEQRNYQLSKKAAELKDFSRQVIDSIQSYILIVDREGKIEGYNSAIQELMGLSSSEAKEQEAPDGRSFSEIFYLPELDARWIDEKIRNGDTFQAKDINYETRDGKSSVIDISIHPRYNQAGEMQGAVLIIDDVTEQKIVEKKLIRSEKLASIGRLSANLAHELNNPLDGALRYIRLLLDQMSEDDPRRIYAEYARDGLMRMSDMIRGLLDFARKSTPILSPTDISQSIEQILSFLSDQVSAQNIDVETEFDENIPIIMNADVEQIFMNIIKNAIQAMPDGGTLSVSAKMVSPQLLEVRFSDTGPGIPEETQEMIFDPFFTTKSFGQGVGLGLSISQGIAESYNGSIEVESEQGKGTIFVVTLPISENGLATSRTDT